MSLLYRAASFAARLLFNPARSMKNRFLNQDTLYAVLAGLALIVAGAVIALSGQTEKTINKTINKTIIKTSARPAASTAGMRFVPGHARRREARQA